MVLTARPGAAADVLLGRYAVGGLIARGGSAEVYRARDLEHGREVAVKLLKSEFVGSSGASRFLREVRLLSTLSHPNIMPVLDSGESEGRLFVVLPLMEGGTLRARLDRERQLPLAEAVRLTCTLGDALHSAHQQGVIHRDVKPENILFSGATPFLADFGIARAIERASWDTPTTTGVALGTPAYMSPEQAAGEGDIDRRTDVYSLGCVLYEMIAGMQAFTGPTRQSVIAQHFTEGPRPLRIYRPTVPAALEEVVAKAMMPLPADRYQTAAEFTQALASLPAETASGTEYPRRAATRRSWHMRPALAAASAVAAGLVLWLLLAPRPGALDPNRIVVFPLAPRGVVRFAPSAGDEVALLIGTAFEHTEPLRWIDGWAWLDSTQRANPMLVTARQARRIARDRGARFYLQGLLVGRADSTTVITRLVDAAGDSVVAQGSASGGPSPESLPLLGLRAVTQVLPHLVDPGRPIDLSPIASRDPAAVASFLWGEREYRQSHFAGALGHYRRAVAQDSGLAFAALKGAQAANWTERNAEAERLLSVALASEGALPPRYAQFARGLQAYLRGDADVAAMHFDLALELDPDWSEGWTALGEVYFHLFPNGQFVDSVAARAFDRARRLDRGFAPPVFHLTELALREGRQATADSLAADFQGFQPDSNWALQLQLTVGCARGDVNRDAWRRWAASHPIEVTKAARSLALLARRYDCAEEGFRAVLDADAVPVDARWMATLGLQSVLVATGRVADARRAIDAAVKSGLRQAMTLYLVDAAAGLGMEDGATEAMWLIAGDYRGMPGYRLWYHATWERRRRNGDSLAAIAAALQANAGRSGSADDRFFADVVLADLAVVRHDTAAALRRLATLRPRGPPAAITWGLWESVPAERLMLAELLLARGRHDDARKVADTFDHPHAVVNLVYLPASLVIRVRAAQALDDDRMERRYLEQLALLGRSDLLKSLR
jgi:tetratricopeptide (TPR) repeat protein